MSDRLKELRDKRGKLTKDARGILDKADAEKRALTNEEDAKYSELFGEIDALRRSIEVEERQIELEREAVEDAVRGEEQRGATSAKHKGGDAEKRQAFQAWLRGGAAGMSGDAYRALTAGTQSQGGYLVTPEEFVARLIKTVDDQVFMRGLATKFAIPKAASLGAPSLDNDPTDADWTTELATGADDDNMSFGKRELHPHPLAKRIKISNTLLRMAMMDVEGLVLQRLAYKFAVTQEKYFLTGNGSNQPLGIFTASNDGIPTSRDVATDNTSSSPTFDGLISAKYALKGQYHANANWMFHRNVLEKISKLKDLEGQYIWRESILAGEPDTILKIPVIQSEFSPNTMTTGLYVGALGDFSNYWIADTLDMQMLRLNELYAETNRTGFIARMEIDGMPVLAEAFVRVKLG